MNEEMYYNLNGISVSDRESYNNAVLLMTMIKRQYYYLTGFSRPDGIIKIGFDYETETKELQSGALIMDFGWGKSFISLKCVMENLPSHAEAGDGSVQNTGKGRLSFDGNSASYEYRIQKDALIPISVRQMNEHIMTVKGEILGFLKSQ